MRSRMPSNVRAPKMMIGITTISNTLWSTIPIPSSNAVTTAQIVRTMKRGENGSRIVSMEPLRRILLLLFLSVAVYSNHQNNALHDISWRGHGYDKASATKLANDLLEKQSVR